MKKQFTLTLLALLFSFCSFASIGGTPGACVGGTSALTDSSLTGGTWSSSNPAIATVSGAGVVTGVSAGSCIISHTVGSAMSVVGFTVSAVPASITGTAMVCVSGITTLSSTTPGGYWLTSNYAIADVGFSSGIVSGTSAGTATISYQVGPGCAAAAVVTVSAIPLGVITGDTDVCAGSTKVLTSSISGGIWSTGNPAVATVGASTGIVTGVAFGSAPIYYTVSGACGTAATAHYMVVNTTTSAAISGPTWVYTGSTDYLYAGTGGGTWTSTNPAIASIDPVTGMVTGVSAGTVTISYTVTGCSGTVTGTMTFTVTNFDIIDGTVYFPGSYTGSVKVWLIRYNPSTLILQAIDSTIVYSGGGSYHYYFMGVPTDSFRIKASPGDSAFLTAGYLPTYHTSSFYWHSADVLYHISGTADYGVDVNMLTGTPTSGPGFIAGSVTTGANKGTSGGVPVVSMQMVLVNAATNAVVQQARTNATGNYTFSNLPLGETYYVFPDSINYLTTPYTGITLTSASPSKAAADFIQHTLSKTVTPILTGVNDLKAGSCVAIFPNPANGKLNITLEMSTAATAQVSITDVAGREVLKSEVSVNKGSATKQIDVSALNSGLYIVHIKSETLNYTSKIQVQH